jgi:hypothetical protein
MKETVDFVETCGERVEACVLYVSFKDIKHVSLDIRFTRIFFLILQ